MHNANREDASHIFENLRKTLGEIDYGDRFSESPVMPITVSIGVHLITSLSPDTHTEAIMLANHAKQRAKGPPDDPKKNCVEFSNAQDREQVSKEILGET